LSDHECKYERQLGRIEAHMETLNTNMGDVTKAITGKDGLTAATKSNTDQIGYLRWVVGFILVGILGTSFYIMRADVSEKIKSDKKVATVACEVKPQS